MKKHKKTKIDRGAFENAVVAWKAPEYLHHEKPLWWYVVALGLAALLVWYGLTTDGWTFSLAIVVFCGTYYLLHREPPPIVEVKISNLGVKIGRHIFPYSNLKNFWVVHDPPYVNKLYLRSTSKLHPDIFVSLHAADAAEVRHVLRKHVRELPGKHEPFSDTLVRLFHL